MSSTPGTTEAVVEYVRTQAASLRIVGAGTWLTAGRPVHANETLNLSALNGIVEYVPGDLTMTVRAGSSLSMLDAVAAGEGQWLGIDPAGSVDGTIGATVATASSGPLAHGIGRMRDIVLGLEVVTGSGSVIRSGGKVVKNVAGFDITRLQTGAWGTLGVITEISLRLRARPEVDETVCVALNPRKPLAAHLLALREIALAALAVELIGSPLAQHLKVGEQQVLLVRLGGNAARVEAQRSSLGLLGYTTVLDSAIWTALRALEGPQAIVARVSHLPSQMSDAFQHVHNEVFSTMGRPGLIRATVARGVIRVVIPGWDDDQPTALPGLIAGLAHPGGHVVWEQLPPTAWNFVQSAVGDPISSALQRTFDPSLRYNPGIMGDRVAT